MSRIKDALTKFVASKSFTATGAIGASADEPFNVRAENILRVVVEGVGENNAVEVKARVAGLSSYVSLGMLYGNIDKIFDVAYYDQLYFDCTAYEADGTPLLYASGFDLALDKPYNLRVALGFVPGRDYVSKFGRIVSVTNSTVDVWNGGGFYTGQPVNTVEELQFFSSSSLDTGEVTFQYLETRFSTEYKTGTVTLQGTTPVNSGITAYRCHTARYNDGSAEDFNKGTITCRHKTTTANIFFVMPVGRSQTNVCAYTVPYGRKMAVERLFADVIGNNSGTAKADLWVRNYGESPRLRRPGYISNIKKFEDEGIVVIPGGADVRVRVVAVGTNLEIIAGFDGIVT